MAGHGLLNYQIALFAVLFFAIAAASGGALAAGMAIDMRTPARLTFLVAALCGAAIGMNGVVWLIYDRGVWSMFYWLRGFGG